METYQQLKAGVIEPAKSELSAPVLFVPKKDSKLRFCIDCRKLNSMTVKDTYPFAKINEFIDTFGEVQYFITLDVRCVFRLLKDEHTQTGRTYDRVYLQHGNLTLHNKAICINQRPHVFSKSIRPHLDTDEGT